MTYYRGMGATPRRGSGLHGLGMDESERLRRNAVAEQLARQWDNNALNYLRARSNYIPSFTVPKGAPYEPEGGVVSGWATASARTDAAQRHQNVVSFLAWSAPPPPNGGTPVTTTPTAPQVPGGGGGYVPPSDGGPAQPLPEVTVLGTPDGPPVALLALAAVAAFLVLSPRSRGA
jgi:hypothetical protein